jgi:hypothetical protein
VSTIGAALLKLIFTALFNCGLNADNILTTFVGAVSLITGISRGTCFTISSIFTGLLIFTVVDFLERLFFACFFLEDYFFLLLAVFFFFAVLVIFAFAFVLFFCHAKT